MLDPYDYLKEETLDENVKMDSWTVADLKKAYTSVEAMFIKSGASPNKDRDIVAMMKAIKKVLQKNGAL